MVNGNRSIIQISNPNKIPLTKDSITKKERLYQHIQTLFKIQNLAAQHIDTLMNMTLMPDKGISKLLFHYWQSTNDFNSMNTLIEYGWVQGDENNNTVSLHPFLKDFISLETKPLIVQALSYSMALAVNGKRKEAKKVLFNILRRIKDIPNFGMTISQTYMQLGLTVMDESPSDAIRYLEKAKSAIDGHLGKNDPYIIALEDNLSTARQRLRIATDKSLIVLRKSDFFQ